jgi:hypothetical protein
MFFGQIPINPASINFSRDRKRSIGAVNMDPKFGGPALQAAMKSSASLVENYDLQSTAPAVEPASSFVENPSETAKRSILQFYRKRSTGSRDAIKGNPPPSTVRAAEASSPFVGTPETSRGVFSFSRNRKRSTDHGNSPPSTSVQVPESSPSFVGIPPEGSGGIFSFSRNRKPSRHGDARENNPDFAANSAAMQSSPSLVQPGTAKGLEKSRSFSRR